MSDEVYPTSIERTTSPQGVRIVWSDGAVAQWTTSRLRRDCPCATCREKRRESDDASAKPMMLPVLSAAESRPLRIEGMNPVGNYAYQIAFSDGHNTGVYTFERLRGVGRDLS